MKKIEISIKEYKYLKEIERLYMENEKEAEELIEKMRWINAIASSIKSKIVASKEIL